MYFQSKRCILQDINAIFLCVLKFLGLNTSADILLERIVEEDTAYLNDRSPGISPVEIENDTKQLLRSESINDTINITRI